MKTHVALAAAAIMLCSMATPSLAEDQPLAKAPQKTLGDEGKLPPTETMSGAVPDMGATPAEPGAASTSPKGPAKTMGDSGTLPATGTMSGAVPPMTGSDAK